MSAASPCTAVTASASKIAATTSAAVSTQLPALLSCFSGSNVQASAYTASYSTSTTCSGSPSPTHCYVSGKTNALKSTSFDPNVVMNSKTFFIRFRLMREEVKRHSGVHRIQAIVQTSANPRLPNCAQWSH